MRPATEQLYLQHNEIKIHAIGKKNIESKLDKY